MVQQSNTGDSADGDGIGTPHELEFITAEDISSAREDEEDIVAYFECPECGATVAEWCDCPGCLWYDGDVWERTMNGPLSEVPDA